MGERPGKSRPDGRLTGLPKDSAANCSQIIAVDRVLPTRRAGKIPRATVETLLSAIDVLLGR